MAWNMSNPLYRWKQKQKSKKKSRSSTHVSAARHRVKHMARKRRSGRRGGFGMKGALNPKSMLAGLGASIIASQFLGDNMIVKGGAGYLAGGIGGVVGAVGLPMVIGTVKGSTGSSTIASSNGW